MKRNYLSLEILTTLCLALGSLTFGPSISISQETSSNLLAFDTGKDAFLLARPERLALGFDPVLPPPLIGIASWYSESDPFINRHTANGEIFDDSQKTCASWDFPFGTSLKVTHLATGNSVICRVNDRGPARRLRRVIDLTKSSFRQIADLKQGLVKVSVERVGKK